MATEELVDVLDEKGNKTGEVKSKSAVHRDGDIHRAVHIWFLNSKNQLLLQLRSAKKDRGANMYDVSVGGHVSVGQTSVEAAVREIREEIGVLINPEELIYLFSTISIKEGDFGPTDPVRHVHDVYLVRKDLDLKQIVLQEEEVTSVRLVDVSELEQWVREKRKDLIIHKEEYAKLFEYLSTN